MVTMRDNDIYIIAKNDATIEIELKDSDNNDYELADDEKLVLTVKKRINDATKIISKEARNGIVTLTSAEMNINAGSYVYDITIVRADNSIETVTEYHRFVVMPQVF